MPQSALASLRDSFVLSCFVFAVDEFSAKCEQSVVQAAPTWLAMQEKIYHTFLDRGIGTFAGDKGDLKIESWSMS